MFCFLFKAYNLKHARDLIRAISKKVKGPQYLYTSHPALTAQNTMYSMKSFANDSMLQASMSRMSLLSRASSKPIVLPTINWLMCLRAPSLSLLCGPTSMNLLVHLILNAIMRFYIIVWDCRFCCLFYFCLWYYLFRQILCVVPNVIEFHLYDAFLSFHSVSKTKTFCHWLNSQYFLPQRYHSVIMFVMQ